MKSSDKIKQEYFDLLHKHEGEDIELIAKNQVQHVIRETARLIALIEEGHQLFNADMHEYKAIAKMGNTFLHNLVLEATKLNIQVQ